MRLRDVYQKWYWKSGNLCQDCSKRDWSSILQPYGKAIVLAACHEAPSFAVRDEHLLSGNDRGRFAHRVHVFERGASPSQPGDYLGCLNLRVPTDDEAHRAVGVAECFLRPPQRMLGPRYSMPLLSSLYTPFFGLLPFPCVPYASQAPISGLCAQTSVYMCLLASLGYGGIARGPFTLTCQAKYRRHRDPAVGGGGPGDGVLVTRDTCVSGTEHPGVAFEVTGLNAYDMRDLINESDVEPREHEPLWAIVRFMRCTPPDEFYQTVFSYVSSSVPLIAIVNPEPLWTTREVSDDDVKHAVVIIGTRGRPWEGDFAIVYHDPSEGPYREAPAEVFIEAMLTDKGSDGSESLRQACLVPIMPRQVAYPMDEVLDWFLPEEGGSPSRLKQMPSVWTVRLLANGNLEKSFPDDLSVREVNDMAEAMYDSCGDLPAYVWAAECFDTSSAGIEHSPDRCTYFDATDSLARPILMYERREDDSMHLFTVDVIGNMVPKCVLHRWKTKDTP